MQMQAAACVCISPGLHVQNASASASRASKKKRGKRENFWGLHAGSKTVFLLVSRVKNDKLSGLQIKKKQPTNQQTNRALGDSTETFLNMGPDGGKRSILAQVW